MKKISYSEIKNMAKNGINTILVLSFMDMSSIKMMTAQEIVESFERIISAGDCSEEELISRSCICTLEDFESQIY